MLLWVAPDGGDAAIWHRSGGVRCPDTVARNVEPAALTRLPIAGKL